MASRPHATRLPRPSLLILLWWLFVSGAVLGCAFPPVDCKLLVWVGLIPLCWAVYQVRHLHTAFLCGYIAGLWFFLLTLHPLVSAHSWTGWAAESPEAFALRMNHQWWFMQGIWVSFALWCAVFWGLWTLVVRWLAPEGGWRLLVVAPSCWVLLPEWARARTTFGFAWAFLGNATADCPTIRQLAALGGTWLLSATLVLVGVGEWLLVQSPRRTGWWKPPAVVAVLVTAGWIGGLLRLQHPLLPDRMVEAAAIQHHKTEYMTADFSVETGLDRSYLPLAQQALQHHAELLILPESIALGTTTLDGTPSQTKPPEWQHPRSAWDTQMAALLHNTSAALIVGLDTVEGGRDYNTLVAWNARGVLGWYHKRRLVPFSEYQPWPWAPWALHGKSEYAPGQGAQLIRWGDVMLGGFICQEVLFPWVTRTSVRNGAMVLVSGGNDGVFGDPAVARVHVDVAKLRAVETGRYLVRAMKTGISAIIDPYGRTLASSRSSEPVVLVWKVGVKHNRTPYVEFGDWVVVVSALLACWAVLTRRKPRLHLDAPPRHQV